jgi:hypothetical protein
MRVWHINKGEHMFIKDNIPRDINTIRRNVETLIPLVERTIPKKHTLFGSIFKFMVIVRTKVRPTGTTKNLEERVIRSFME